MEKERGEVRRNDNKKGRIFILKLEKAEETRRVIRFALQCAHVIFMSRDATYLTYLLYVEVGTCTSKILYMHMHMYARMCTRVCIREWSRHK